MIDILALGAHADDVEFSCGGWLALATARNQLVGIVDFTRGELATNGTPAIRAQEAAAAAAELGVAFRDNLGLPDGGLQADNTEQLAAVVAAIRQHRPTLLLAPNATARHPDHTATAILSERAVFFAGVKNFRPDLGAAFQPLRLIVYPQRRELRPSFVVDITPVIEIKARAIACYRSQIGEGLPTLVNHPLGSSAFDKRDQYWGATIGVGHGEPYLISGPLPMSDPLVHFQAHADRPALYP